MNVVLRPMTEETHRTYLREHEEEYARDRMTTDRESFAEALRTTRDQHAALLPQGLSTPGHYFFTVEDESRGRQVGYVWFACRPPSQELFLYHIRINEAVRRQGYGQAALAAIDQKAKELGCRAVWLNVMAHNQGAIDFLPVPGLPRRRTAHEQTLGSGPGSAHKKAAGRIPRLGET
jgi:RimJ/RimL family protein N-acetyltransferase